MTDFLLNHFNAVAFRGLVRRRSAEDRPCLPTGLPENFAADTVWMLDLALRGELRRVPAPLYSKRYHAGSVHAGWTTWSREKLITLWAQHTAACVRIALEQVEDPRDGEIVLAAGFIRAVGIGKAAEDYAAPKGPRETAAATAIFCDALADISSSRLASILARPDASHLRSIMARHASRDSTFRFGSCPRSAFRMRQAPSARAPE